MLFYIVFGPIVPRLGLVTGLLIMFVCVSLCNIITFRRQNGRISEVASRAETPFPKVPLGAHF